MKKVFLTISIFLIMAIFVLALSRVPISFYGNALDEKSQPLVGYVITISGAPNCSSRLTDNSGFFEISGQPPAGYYALTATKGSIFLTTDGLYYYPGPGNTINLGNVKFYKN